MNPSEVILEQQDQCDKSSNIQTNKDECKDASINRDNPADKVMNTDLKHINLIKS